MLQVPLTFIYGELDWTNPVGGARVCEQIKQQRGQLTDADLQITSIPHAGHYPFLDQPEHFMTALLQQTRPYRSGNYLYLLDISILDRDTLLTVWAYVVCPHI